MKRKYFHGPIALVLICALLVLTFPISGCGGGGGGGSDSNININPPTPNPTSTTSPTPNPTTSPTPNPTSTPTPEPIIDSYIEVEFDSNGNEIFIVHNADGQTGDIELLKPILDKFANNESSISFAFPNEESGSLDRYTIDMFGYIARIIWHDHYVGGCIKKNKHHLGIALHNKTTHKDLADFHIVVWWNNGPWFGIYNSGNIGQFCFNSEEAYHKLKNAIKDVLLSVNIPAFIASAIAATLAAIIIYLVPVVLAKNNDGPNNPDPIIGPISPPNPIPTTIPATTTLWEYYRVSNKPLPSKDIRAQFYEMLGLGSANDYNGSADQNTRLLNVLKEKGISPLTVAELEAIIGPIPSNDNAVFLVWPGDPNSPEAPEFGNTKEWGTNYRYWIHIYAKNTGDTVWKAGKYYLQNNIRGSGMADYSDHFMLDRDIRPGEVWTSQLWFNTPNKQCDYRFTFRMGKDPYTEFGKYINWDVFVGYASGDAIQFIQWPGTVGSPEVPEFNTKFMKPNEQFWLDIWVYNIGSTILKANKYYIQYNQALPGYSDHIYLDRDVKPGEVYSKRLIFVAPSTKSEKILTFRFGKDPYQDFGPYQNWRLITDPDYQRGVYFVLAPGNADSPIAQEFYQKQVKTGENFSIDYWVVNKTNEPLRANENQFQINSTSREFGNFPEIIRFNRDAYSNEVWHIRMNYKAPNKAGVYILTSAIHNDVTGVTKPYINYTVTVSP